MSKLEVVDVASLAIASPSREHIGLGARAPVPIWRYVDGKRGHENQSAALLEALAERLPVEETRVRVPPHGALKSAWQAIHSRGQPNLPRPQLVIGAGHATHLPVLAAGRAHGARTVVLMTPTLPSFLFDLAIVPEHDGVPPAPHRLVTRGGLNRMRPAEPKIANAGLILIGGPSKHHQWSTQDLAEQVRNVVASETEIDWTLTDSRRTPADCLQAIKRLGLPHLRVVPYQDTDESWLPSRLGLASGVWVTADSVNMVYESLSAGAATGILEVPSRSAGNFSRVSRVVSGLDRLVAEGWVTPYSQWRDGVPLRIPPAPLAEAERCARWIDEHWLQNNVH